MADWKDTKLWGKLENKNTQEGTTIRNVLSNENFLPKIQKILAKGETAISDFTLHDEDHSFRVAELMIKVIPSETLEILSEYELMLLLLSAYLHDIGMTPSLSKVKAIQEILIDGKSINLSKTERKKLQHWLDEQDSDFELGVDKYLTENFEGHKNLFQTIKYYCRERHNDWSGEWIDENLKDIKIGNYTNWQEDLKNVCKSHHYGFTDLMNAKFDTLPIENQVVNLRYLALCLRMADVLENDPERTPDVIFQHREVSKDSTIYWYKDHSFSIDIRHDAPIAIYARPKSAFIHKAVLDTASQIETELKLCQDIFNSEKINNALTKRFRKEYKWTLQSYISKTIEPLNNQYEFIEGYFRPKIAKVLELLGGEQLYGNTNSAVRELIQNAFDATRIQIAYEIVKTDLDYNDWALKLGEKYPVKIKLEKDELDNYWLICEDKGIGMSKRIITDYLLVTGASKSNEISELERECRKKGFELERTGQFGIGVLSYFMIADQIIFTTKRSELSSEEDHEAWQFTVHGIGDFGELKKVNKSIHGTEIRLRLKKGLFDLDKYKKWELELSNYIKNKLSKIPSAFNFLPIKCEAINFSSGWVIDKDSDNYSDYQWRGFRFTKSFPYEIDEDEEKFEQKKEEELNQIISEDFNKKIKYLRKEGDLPNGYGKYLISLPYFELKDGNSLIYFYEGFDLIGYEYLEESYKDYRIERYFNFEISWKGIHISTNLNDEHTIPEEHIHSQYSYDLILDFIKHDKNKSISVSRDFFNINESLAWRLIDFCDEIYQKMISDNSLLFKGEYSFINFMKSKNKDVLSENNKMFYLENKIIKFDICDSAIISNVEISEYNQPIKNSEFPIVSINKEEVNIYYKTDFSINRTDYDFDIVFNSSREVDFKLFCRNIKEAIDKSIKVKSSLIEDDRFFAVNIPIEFKNILGIAKQTLLYNSTYEFLLKSKLFEDSFDFFTKYKELKQLLHNNLEKAAEILQKEKYATIATMICFEKNVKKNSLFKNENIKNSLSIHKDKYVLINESKDFFLVGISDFSIKKIEKLSELESIFGKLKEENKYTIQ